MWKIFHEDTNFQVTLLIFLTSYLNVTDSSHKCFESYVLWHMGTLNKYIYYTSPVFYFTVMTFMKILCYMISYLKKNWWHNIPPSWLSDWICNVTQKVRMSQDIRGKELEIHTRTDNITTLKIIVLGFLVFLSLYSIPSSFPFSN